MTESFCIHAPEFIEVYGEDVYGWKYGKARCRHCGVVYLVAPIGPAISGLFPSSASSATSSRSEDLLQAKTMAKELFALAAYAALVWVKHKLRRRL